MNIDLVSQESSSDQTSTDLVSDGDSDQMKTDIAVMVTMTK